LGFAMTQQVADAESYRQLDNWVRGQVDCRIGEGTQSLAGGCKFGAPCTPLTKNGAWRPVLDRVAPNIVRRSHPAPNNRLGSENPWDQVATPTTEISRPLGRFSRPPKQRPQPPTIKLTIADKMGEATHAQGPRGLLWWKGKRLVQPVSSRH
jgi:hypothetical protein